MFQWFRSRNCPKCGSEDGLRTFIERNKPIDAVSGNCLECGFSYYTKEVQLELGEVNKCRRIYGLEPLTQLKEQAE